MSAAKVIYEVNIHIDRARRAEFDEWLSKHVQQMLALPGFTDARILDGDDDGDRVLRCVHYQLSSQEALDQYLKEHADRMRADGVARFGNDMDASRRIFAQRGEPVHDQCLNCAAALAGQYCAQCGQRHGSRMISVRELLRDVFEDLADWDARVWRSLRPLLLRPGHLTREYLNGRRAHYTPPLRLYLVLSLFFFLLSSVGFFGDIDVADIEAHEDSVASPAPVDTGLVEEADGSFRCGELTFQFSLPGVPADAVRARVVRACERFLAPGGHQELINEFMDIVPRLLIVLLPLIALAGKVYHMFLPRYYVEHLLFYTHYHSFVFLFLIVVAAIIHTVSRIPGGDGLLVWLQTGTGLYLAWYLFASLRAVFGQSAMTTGVKTMAIGVTYLISGVFVALAGVVITAMFA